MSLDPRSEFRRLPIAPVPHLRPWGMMEMLDRTVRLIFLNLGPLVAMAAIASALMTVSPILSNQIPKDPKEVTEAHTPLFLGVILLFFVQLIPMAAMMLFSMQKMLFPTRRVRPGVFFRTIGVRFFRFVVTALAINAVVATLLMLSQLAGGFIGTITVVIALYLMMTWGLSLPVSILENRFAIAAFARSSQLMSRPLGQIGRWDGPRRRLFILLLLLIVMMFGVLLVGKLIENTVTLPDAIPSLGLAENPLGLAVNFVVYLLITLYGYPAITALYLSSRMNHEGLDLELRLANLAQDTDIDELVSEPGRDVVRPA